MNTSTCNACHRPVRWAKTQAGKNIPLDPTPVGGGNILLRGELAVIVDTNPLIERYVSHFSTCPQADAFRSKRKGGRR